MCEPLKQEKERLTWFLQVSYIRLYVHDAIFRIISDDEIRVCVHDTIFRIENILKFTDHGCYLKSRITVGK